MGDYVQFLFKIIGAHENKSIKILSLLRKIICNTYHTKFPISTLTYAQYESLCGVCDIFINDLEGVKDEDLAQGTDPDSSSKVSNSTMA